VTLTPAQQLVMGLTSGGTLLEQARQKLCELSSLEEREITELLEQQRLGPLVEYNLRSQDALQDCSGEMQEFLEQDRFWWTNQSRLQRLVLTQVSNILEGAGIPAIALKGAHLAWHVYDHPSHRPLRDLDILVPEARIKDGAALLQSIGCVVIAEQTSPGDLLDWANYEIKFLHPLGIVIELHRGLWYFAVEGGVEDFSLRPEFWIEDSPYYCWIKGVRYLSETYRYLHILVHHVYKHHLGVGPLGLYDLRLLIASPSLSQSEVMSELATIGAPSLDRMARNLVDVFNGGQAEDALNDLLPLIFLTPEQNQLIYRTRRSIRKRVLIWLKIQWFGGQWSATPKSSRRLLDGTLRIARRAPSMALRPGLHTQIRERLARLVRNPRQGKPELHNAPFLLAAEKLRLAITKSSLK
jgi:hypothetical protein